MPADQQDVAASLLSTIGRIRDLLGRSQARQSWEAYLQLELLQHYAADETNGTRKSRSDLATKVLQRMRDHGLTSRQRQLLRSREFVELATGLSQWSAAGIDLVHIYAIRLLAFQAHLHRHIGAVAHTGQGEGAIKMYLDPVELVQETLVDQLLYKTTCRHHGAHGVGAGRADTHFKQFENTEAHTYILEARSRGSRLPAWSLLAGLG